MGRTDKINFVTLFMLCGIIVSIAYHYFMGAYSGKSYPDNTFLFLPSIKFTDFYDVFRASASRIPYSSYSIYFPFAYIFTYPLTIFSETTAYLLFVVVFACVFLWISYNFVKTENIILDSKNVLILMFSYPVLFNIDRGNYESLIFIMLFLFVIFFQRGQHLLAIMFLSFAGAMKLYPLVFVQLYIAEKKYLHALAVILATVLLMIGSILLFNGPFMVHVDGHSYQMQEYFKYYVIDNRGIGHGISFFSLLKLLIYFFVSGMGISQAVVKYNLTDFYTGFCLVVLLLCFVTLLIAGNCQFWIKLALIVFPMIALPYASGDYKIIHLMIPLYYFFGAEEARFDAWCAAAFGLLLIPKSYYYFPGIFTDSGYADVSLAVLLNPLILLGFLASLIAVQLSRASASLVRETLKDHLGELKNIVLFRRNKQGGGLEG